MAPVSLVAMVSPLAMVLGHALGARQQGFARQADFTCARVNANDLNLHLIAFFKDVFDFFNAFISNFGDVQQSALSGEIDKNAIGHDGFHHGIIDVSHFGCKGNFLNFGHGLFDAFGI